ncbi:MAG TPA: hypothetical protein VH986_06285 [Acidimicrobiia bacterium]
MPTKTSDATTAITDAIVSGVKQSQELAFSGLNAWVDFTEKAFSVPKSDALPFAESLPNPREFVEAYFGFAEELLATEKEFAIKLVDTVATK